MSVDVSLRSKKRITVQYYRETLPELLQVGQYFRFRNFCNSVKNLICVVLHFCSNKFVCNDWLVLFFQELDDVYHESSSVVAETLVQGADVMSLKVRLSYFSARWRSCRLLSCCFPCGAICYSNMHFFFPLLQYKFFSFTFYSQQKWAEGMKRWVRRPNLYNLLKI